MSHNEINLLIIQDNSGTNLDKQLCYFFLFVSLLDQLLQNTMDILFGRFLLIEALDHAL